MKTLDTPVARFVERGLDDYEFWLKNGDPSSDGYTEDDLRGLAADAEMAREWLEMFYRRSGH